MPLIAQDLLEEGAVFGASARLRGTIGMTMTIITITTRCGGASG